MSYMINMYKENEKDASYTVGLQRTVTVIHSLLNEEFTIRKTE